MFPLYRRFRCHEYIPNRLQSGENSRGDLRLFHRNGRARTAPIPQYKTHLQGHGFIRTRMTVSGKIDGPSKVRTACFAVKQKEISAGHSIFKKRPLKKFSYFHIPILDKRVVESIAKRGLCRRWKLKISAIKIRFRKNYINFTNFSTQFSMKERRHL